MASTGEKYPRRRLRTSYVSTVISISLVLFMLGLVGMIIINARKLSDYVRENIVFSLIIHEEAKEADVARLQKRLDAEHYVKYTEFVDREKAASVLQEELGEDFVSFLGYNPLLASIDVYLKADYAVPDSIAWIEKKLTSGTEVKEVFYQKSLVDAINENARKISFVLLGFSGLLLIVAVALINNSIRLAIYSKRFLIRSMQLVGATQGFIRRPFLWKGVANGIYGALIAIILLLLVIYEVRKEIPELFRLEDVEMIAMLLGMVIALGVVISWICTIFAVRKYLRMKLEQLF